MISLVETLQSIYLRPEHRIKDYMAYTSLIQSNLAVLPSLLNDAKLASPQFKKAVLTMVNILSDPIKSTNQDLVVGTVTKQLPRLVGTKAPKRQHQPEPSFPSQERAQPTAKQIQENQKRIEAATLQNRQNTTTTQTTNDVSSKIKPPKM